MASKKVVFFASEAAWSDIFSENLIQRSKAYEEVKYTIIVFVLLHCAATNKLWDITFNLLGFAYVNDFFILRRKGLRDWDIAQLCFSLFIFLDALGRKE